MSRKEISMKELVKIINEELAKTEECCDCRISGVKKLAELDNGSNWSGETNFNSGESDYILCTEVVKEVIDNTRQKYNLKH